MKNFRVKFPSDLEEKILKKTQIVYDCFTFFNELDLLEIRLKELEKKVDFFVICEATKTFSGKKKPLYFKDNLNLFKNWEEKIIHVIVDDMPPITLLDKFLVFLEKNLPRRPQLFLRKLLTRVIGGVSRYKLEEYQRRAIIDGLAYAREEDIILGIDIDEIPRAAKIDEMVFSLSKSRYAEFEQQNYRFFLNGQVIGKAAISPGTRACKFKTLKNELKGKIDFLRTTPYFWRHFHPELYGKGNYYKIKNGGWHFSYLGGVNKVIEKLSSITHPEVDVKKFKDPSKVKEMIAQGEFGQDLKLNYIKIDNSFPRSIKDHKFKQYIWSFNDDL